MVSNSAFSYRLSSDSTAVRPLRLLLYIEWILLTMAALITITAMVIYQAFLISWPQPILFGLLAMMGLYLPKTQLKAKIFYTVAELGIFSILVISCLDNPLFIRTLPLLGFVIVIRSCQIFQKQGKIVVASFILSLNVFTSLILGQRPINQNLSRLIANPESWQVSLLQTNAIVLFTLVLLFVFLLVDALLSVHKNQQKLSLAHNRLQQYALQVEAQAALEERNRIAREIHDSLGHSLTAQTVLLENVLLFWEKDPERAKSYLLKAKDSSYQALKDVSRAVTALRDSPKFDQPLPIRITELVNKVCQSTSSPINSECKIDVTKPLSNELSLAVYRIVQEALTNAVKHAQASQLSVQLSTKHQSIHLQILDNGKGFDPSKNTTGFGLRGIKERTNTLGGTYQISSELGAGCRIEVKLPLSKPLKYSVEADGKM